MEVAAAFFITLSGLSAFIWVNVEKHTIFILWSQIDFDIAILASDRVRRPREGTGGSEGYTRFTSAEQYS